MELNSTAHHQGLVHDDPILVEVQLQSKHIQQLPHDADAGDLGLPEEAGRIGPTRI